MRFDGYYILTDLWGIDNLFTRSAQFTKWYLRRNLLGLDMPCPITIPERKEQLKMISYSLYAWTYRFFLYLGIAVLVYYSFTKTIGIILFCLEIMVFIVQPIIEEIKVLRKMKHKFKLNLKLQLVKVLALKDQTLTQLMLKSLVFLTPAKFKQLLSQIDCGFL